MANYKCFSCEKTIKPEYVKKKIRCPYCGLKILYKSRVVTAKLKAV